MPRPGIIAIDGPVASGKTSVGRRLSRELGYRFLDTGLMYRAVTWLALERGIDLQDETALGSLASQTALRVKDPPSDSVLINGEEVAEEELRRPEVDRAVSLVAGIPRVRDALVKQQREIAREGRIVVVGRDIGTVVLTNADLKLFLVASASERARRRYLELTEQGRPVEYEKVLADLEARDKLDTGRRHSPLRPASDAVSLNTDGSIVEQVTEKVKELIGKD